jgi:hypothetical protein
LRKIGAHDDSVILVWTPLPNEVIHAFGRVGIDRAENVLEDAVAVECGPVVAPVAIGLTHRVVVGDINARLVIVLVGSAWLGSRASRLVLVGFRESGANHSWILDILIVLA